MFLGIEIGGTKLQLGVGDGAGGALAAVERRSVDPTRGAAGILAELKSAGTALLQQHPVRQIGIGFGGPVDSSTGRTTKSHQIEGWDDFPLVDWLQETFRLPARLGNDCDVAALAEARYGAGVGARTVFFVTVGTGVGGGLVIDGQLYGAGRPAVAEIGHLRPGLHAETPDATVESIANGWGIAAAARGLLAGTELANETYKADLLRRCDNDPQKLTCVTVARGAADGNPIAREVLGRACQALGWAIAQVVTLLAPEVVVVGGGVSLIGETLFLAPVREAAARYVFPPLLNSYSIVPAKLGELAVVHGAIALAAG